jgi:hypothetical protein
MEELKLEVYRILEKPMEQRSTHESKYVEDVLRRNMRKNEGDRLRRLRKRLGDQEDLKLPPLSRRKGPVFTTAHLQMNKIYKEYNLRKNEPQVETPAVEEHCQQRTSSLISDLSMMPSVEPYHLEGLAQRNMEGKIDATGMGLVWPGEDHTRNSFSGTRENLTTTRDTMPATNQQFFEPVWHHQSPSLIYQADFAAANSSIAATTFNHSLLAVGHNQVQSSPFLFQRHFQQPHQGPQPLPCWQHFKTPTSCTGIRR